VFDLQMAGYGTATLELLTPPSPSGPVLNFLRLTYKVRAMMRESLERSTLTHRGGLLQRESARASVSDRDPEFMERQKVLTAFDNVGVNIWKEAKRGYSVWIVQNPTTSLADDVAVTKRTLALRENEPAG